MKRFTDQFYLLQGHSLKRIDPFEAPLVPSDLATSPPAEELAVSVPYLHAALVARASAIADLPRRFEAANGEAVDERDLPFSANWPDLLWRTEYSLCLYGCAYWFRVRNAVRIRTIRWLDPCTVSPRVDPRRGLYAFERNVGRLEKYELDENGLHKQLVYFWLPGLREVAPGAAPIVAARRAAEVLRSVDKFADQFFDQGGMPITLLVIPPSTPDAERDRLESRFQRLAHGIRNAFKPVAVRANVEVRTLGATPANLGMTDLVTSKRDAILAALGVPISIVLGTAVNYATAAQEAKNFIAHTVAPRARLLEYEINRQILAEFGLTLRFDVESLPVMREDERQAATAFQQYVASGLAPEQAAEVVGIALPERPPSLAPLSEPELESEYRRWWTKARNAVRYGRSADVEFVTESIPRHEYLAIREALKGAQTIEEVDAVFAAAPFLGACLESLHAPRVH